MIASFKLRSAGKIGLRQKMFRSWGEEHDAKAYSYQCFPSDINENSNYKGFRFLATWTFSGGAFARILVYNRYTCPAGQKEGVVSSSCCIITYLIPSKELMLRVERRKQINPFNTHPPKTHIIQTSIGPPPCTGPRGHTCV